MAKYNNSDIVWRKLQYSVVSTLGYYCHYSNMAIVL